VNQMLILQPVVLLAWWTVLILLLIPYRRFLAVYRKEAEIDDFRLGESERVAEHVQLANRNYMNLLQVPVLFYLTCLILLLTSSVTETTLYLAWAYLGVRVVHSAIHVSYNKVAHRLIAFVASNVVLFALMATMTSTVIL